LNNRILRIGCFAAVVVGGFAELSRATPFTCAPATSLLCWTVAGTASASSATAGSGSTTPSDVLASTLQSDLGIENFTSVSGIQASDGSALFQTLTLSPGTVFSFDWTATFEPSAVGFAWAWADGQLFTLAEQTAPVGPVGPTGPTGLLDPEGVFSYTITLDGVQTIGFGVVNGAIGVTGPTGPTGDPSITVNQLGVTTPVPEPASWMLIGAALLAVAAVLRLSHSPTK